MAEYHSFEQYQYELGKAVQPYRALLRHELRSADYTKAYYEQDFSSSWEYAEGHKCSHAHCGAVRWVLSNGVERVALQCVACGYKDGNGVRRSDYPDFAELPKLDEELIEDGRTTWDDFTGALVEVHREIVQEFENRQKDLSELDRMAQNAEWWAKYNLYLKSAEWQSKRDRVLERDRHICQACLRRDAFHVHHLTYKHVFNEPLFDLVSVCETCHRGLHPHMQEALNGQAA